MGTGDGNFTTPHSLAVNSSGYVFVADSGNNRIKIFTPNGAYVTKWGSRGAGNGQFVWPDGIAVTSSDDVDFADLDNHRIQKFSPPAASVTPPVASFTTNTTSGTAPLAVLSMTHLLIPQLRSST